MGLAPFANRTANSWRAVDPLQIVESRLVRGIFDNTSLLYGCWFSRAARVAKGSGDQRTGECTRKTAGFRPRGEDLFSAHLRPCSSATCPLAGGKASMETYQGRPNVYDLKVASVLHRATPGMLSLLRAQKSIIVVQIQTKNMAMHKRDQISLPTLFQLAEVQKARNNNTQIAFVRHSSIHPHSAPLNSTSHISTQLKSTPFSSTPHPP